ncbi:P-loop containing nucleoside triphosphate hydrolase protein [Didymella exigua CBS 183.55]|uniref:P-loop containing nucleoside triphosphate hydrolase protein n=1 Tax=Didymella exigua CBS 183.55 TaxID=1150837 RepID=A0A6A5RHZ6_9PLEO|nr:P-loop containing nucleoside triphosphate hydrolase protein [Didymella exigua CBS 183.55]KAF1926718.1 P-loop containing nucleoside triphosphate hydrolase protein [Didymella exigua CBS 183.55]
MDLPQIESLGETLSAATEQQRRVAVGGTISSLAARYEQWRTHLLAARGELEALIDFSEDQHFDESPVQLCASVADRVRVLRAHMEAHVANAVRGELLRNGIAVALVGAPNAGKSSLLNRIVGREAAIVSHEAGTTRDIVDVSLDLAGWLVRIGDMAGLRRPGLVGADGVGAVEQEGIRRAKQRALESDVLIVVQDATADMDPEVAETAKQCIDSGINVLVAVNKIDQLPSTPGVEDAWRAQLHSTLGIAAAHVSFISCVDASTPLPKDPGNIQAFLSTLTRTFCDMTAALVPDSGSDSGSDPSSDPSDPDPDPSLWQESLGATERQRILVSECLAHLDSFLADAAGDFDVDIVLAAESLRSAADALARITGRGEGGDVEEVLGVVFEK